MNSNVLVGETFEQTKELEGFPYNAVGHHWRVDNVSGKYTILKRGTVGLGVTEQELEDYFKPSVEPYDNSYSNNYDDGVEDVEVVEDDEYDEEYDEEYDNSDTIDEDNLEVEETKQESKFRSFLRKFKLSK